MFLAQRIVLLTGDERDYIALPTTDGMTGFMPAPHHQSTTNNALWFSNKALAFGALPISALSALPLTTRKWRYNMKVKLTTVLLLAAILSTIGISSTTSVMVSESTKELPGVTAADVSTATLTNVSTAAMNPESQIPEEVIDGAKNPEKIPDRAAYSLLFRFLSGRKTDEEKHRARAYLKMVFSCPDCEGQAVFENNEAEIAMIMSAAAEFEKRVGVIDLRAKAVYDLSGAEHSKEDKIKLSRLQSQKEALVDEVSASLLRRLGVKGTQKMRRFVKEHMKPKIKITPASPGSEAQSANSAV